MSKYSKSAEYRHLYDDPRWQRIRKEAFERDDMICQICERYCIGTHKDHPLCPVGDHIKEHKGDEDLFFDVDNVQTLCKRDHDTIKRGIEARGYSIETDDEGWPIDPKHPANRRA